MAVAWNKEQEQQSGFRKLYVKLSAKDIDEARVR